MWSTSRLKHFKNVEIPRWKGLPTSSGSSSERVVYAALELKNGSNTFYNAPYGNGTCTAPGTCVSGHQRAPKRCPRRDPDRRVACHRPHSRREEPLRSTAGRMEAQHPTKQRESRYSPRELPLPSQPIGRTCPFCT